MRCKAKQPGCVFEEEARGRGKTASLQMELVAQFPFCFSHKFRPIPVYKTASHTTGHGTMLHGGSSSSSKLRNSILGSALRRVVQAAKRRQNHAAAERPWPTD
jgi:hypothetical protein